MTKNSESKIKRMNSRTIETLAAIQTLIDMGDADGAKHLAAGMQILEELERDGVLADFENITDDEMQAIDKEYHYE